MHLYSYILTPLFLLFSSSSWSQDRPLVVATASIMADMAKNIGGDFIEVKSIVPIGGDPHIYDATPEDAKLAETADLVLVNGLTFEGWLSELIENSGSEAPVHTITNGIDAIASLTYQNATDPHAWMDPILGQIYIKSWFLTIMFTSSK
jgi:ABC-type Zn uptake system ZnuABC Zn-binding protein ZnuA